MMSDQQVTAVLRQLAIVWGDFASAVDTLPIIAKLLRGKFRLEDYRLFLLNHRQQVIEGSRWIARAASSVTGTFDEQRSWLLKHAVNEHRDYKMLEENFLSVGGALSEIQTAPKNIGTEALHAFMLQRAGEPNPFDLLGAMFIIEGLGQQKAGLWGRLIQEQLALKDAQVSFLLYHGANDESHMQEFATVLASGILAIDGMAEQIVKTAKITARLYRLQLEEIGNI